SAAGDVVIGQDVGGVAVDFHDDAAAGADLLKASAGHIAVVVVVIVVIALGLVVTAAVRRIAEESAKHVIRQAMASALDGLAYVDSHDRRLHRLPDIAESRGHVFNRLELFVSCLYFLLLLGEGGVAQNRLPAEP